MNKVILKLDASALKKSACPLAFYRTVVEGYRSPVRYNDTIYGTAVHRFCAVMCYTGGNFATAVQEAIKCFRSKPFLIRKRKDHLNEKHLINTCLNYWEQYVSKESEFEMVINPVATCWKCEGKGTIQVTPENLDACPECNGQGTRPQPMVEVNFEIPYIATEIDGIEYVVMVDGTIDRFGKFKNGCFAVRDYKTTSSYDCSGFFEQFKLSPQFLLYIWALKKMAANNPDSQLAKIVTSTPIGACIDGIFLKSAKETEFHKSEVFIPKPEQLNKFEELLEKKAMQLINLISGLTKIEPMGIVEGTCHHIVACDYFAVCSAPDEVAGKHILRNEFEKKPYDPLHFND